MGRKYNPGGYVVKGNKNEKAVNAPVSNTVKLSQKI